FDTVIVTEQINGGVLADAVKIGDIVKKGDLLVRLDDRLIQATLDTNRLLVAANKVKIRDLTRQLDGYTALQKKSMGTLLDVEKSEITLAEAREALPKATMTLRQA